MIEQDRYCVDKLQQINATTAAPDKVGTIIAEPHVRTALAKRTAPKGLLTAPQETFEKRAGRVMYGLMRRDDVIAKLRDAEPALREIGVERFTFLGLMRATKHSRAPTSMCSSCQLRTES